MNDEIERLAKDNCQMCLGAKGGVRGNENVKAGVVLCDYCSVLVLRIESETRRQAFEEAARICKSKGDAESDYRMKRPYLPPSEVNQYVEREVAFYVCEKTLQARADSLKESQ